MSGTNCLGIIGISQVADQQELDGAYINMAFEWAKLSKADRKQVGAIIVKESQIISDGFNGTPRGFDNACEDGAGKTKPEVLHAESNAILKLSKSTQSGDGATLYLTCSPCYDCAKLIIQAGISRVVYKEVYRSRAGLILLERAGVEIDRFFKTVDKSNTEKVSESIASIVREQRGSLRNLPHG